MRNTTNPIELTSDDFTLLCDVCDAPVPPHVTTFDALASHVATTYADDVVTCATIIENIADALVMIDDRYTTFDALRALRAPLAA